MRCDGCCCRKVFCDKKKNNTEPCHEDIIKMNVDTDILDKDGNKIEITTPEPEYVSEIFSK